MRFRSFKSNVETIRTTNDDFADLASQEFAARYTGLKLASLGSTIRAQQFESRLRNEFRQMLKTWRENALAHKDEREREGSPAARPSFNFENSNWNRCQTCTTRARSKSCDGSDRRLWRRLHTAKQADKSQKEELVCKLSCREVTEARVGRLSFNSRILFDASLLECDVSTG